MLPERLFRYDGLEDSAQALELYSQASSLVPSDPAILSKLGDIYDSEGDKSQAFQCNYEVSEQRRKEDCNHVRLELSLISSEHRSYQVAR